MPNYKLLAKTPDVEKWISWTQPTLLSNGTLGGDAFAVGSDPAEFGGYQAYYPFNPHGLDNEATGWVVVGNTANYIMYNPVPLKITNITIQNRNEAGTPRSVLRGTVFASNSNGAWQELTTFTNNVTPPLGIWNVDLSANIQGYKYYRIQCFNNDSFVGIGKITLSAVALNPEYKLTYKSLKGNNGRYYALKTMGE